MQQQEPVQCQYDTVTHAIMQAGLAAGHAECRICRPGVESVGHCISCNLPLCKDHASTHDGRCPHVVRRIVRGTQWEAWKIVSQIHRLLGPAHPTPISHASTISRTLAGAHPVVSFYVGIASGTSREAAFSRRYDDWKKTNHITKMVEVWYGDTQEEAKEMEQELVSELQDLYGHCINRSDGGEGRPAQGPRHYVYIALADTSVDPSDAMRVRLRYILQSRPPRNEPTTLANYNAAVNASFQAFVAAWNHGQNQNG